MSVETSRTTLAHWDARLPELEARIPRLKKESESAKAELEKHSKALAEEQGNVAQARQQYQAECRKLARGEDSSALKLKVAIQETEAKIEGMQRLLAEAQQKASAAHAPFAEAERELAEARRERDLASRHLKAEESLERVGGKLLSLLEEVSAAKQAVNDLTQESNMRPYVHGQGNRLWNLEDKLRAAKVQFF